mgnify:CR=1 FL=1
MAFTADKVRQGVQKDTGYSIDNSCRVTADAGAKLYRTFGTPTNQKKWTWSFWMKVSKTGGSWRGLGEAYNTNDWAALKPGGEMYWHAASGANFTTSMLFRDPSAWYHIIIAFDSTQGTASDRLNLYVNGVLITDFSSITYPSLNETNTWNSTARHSFLSIPSDPSSYNTFNGYGAEMYWIDGTAKNQYDFGEFDADYNHWKPIAYAGSYGNNGCYLDFSNSGSLGTDASSNTNNWTVNNLAATDQMLDSPTNNFCTMNPNSPNTQALSQGNLHSTGNTGRSAVATQGMTTGKWYWEFYWTGGNNEVRIGATDDVSNGGYGGGIHAYSYTGNIANYLSGGNTNISCSPSMSENSIIGWAWDADIGELKAFVNGTAVNSGAAIVTGFTGYTLHPHGGQGASGYNIFYNFGQDSTFHNTKGSSGSYADSNGIGDFYYEPPTDFLALCTSNLPDPAVIPSEHFNTVLWTGTGSSNARTDVGFQPDFTWIKGRSHISNHRLMNSIAGATKYLLSNAPQAEGTDSQVMSSFDSNGFTVGTEDDTNGSSKTFVAWNWKAGGTGVSNTNGSITSTVSANADAGFSIVSWTGDGSDATIGHSLNSVPKMIIHKHRSGSVQWNVYHESAGTGGYLRIDGTHAWNSNSGFFGTAPTSSVFSPGSHSYMSGSGHNNIAYCFADVDGYSKVGSYTGNGSTDGTFVYTGFRPAYVMIKDSGNAEQWWIFDSTRDVDNVAHHRLGADGSGTEGTNIAGAADNIDFVSNGIKIRSNGGSVGGNTGSTYIFIAFAESPFKHTNAR